MAGRRQDSKFQILRTRQQLEKFLDSPLRALALALSDCLDAVSGGNADEEAKEVTVDYVSKVLERLPSEMDDRFYFDGYMIQSIVDSWSQGRLKCSRMIVPTYRERWGHEAMWVPTPSGSLHRLDLIHIPREHNHEMPSLLEYPWLCHELGHYLLSRHGQRLAELFAPYLQELVSDLQIRSIADKGIARMRADKAIRDIEEYWKIWTKEIAIDAIALWSCGPSYLEAFRDAHESVSNPFLIEETHPPVELRTTALVQAAYQLGWHEYVKALEEILDQWERLRIRGAPQNKYSYLRRRELINGCLESAFEYCRYMEFSRLGPGDLSRIRGTLKRGDDLSNGVDLIAAAWLVFREQGEEIYEKWEAQTVRLLINEIRQ
jgi:hypothetical protein